MPKVFRRVLLAAGVLSVCACTESFPTGINYVLDAHPRIVVNRQGQSWRMLSDDQDVTAAVGLKTQETPAKESLELPVYFSLSNGRLVGLPKTFALVDETLARIRCMGCPADKAIWTRHVAR
jgi:hypothetical protein